MKKNYHLKFSICTTTKTTLSKWRESASREQKSSECLSFKLTLEMNKILKKKIKILKKKRMKKFWHSKITSLSMMEKRGLIVKKCRKMSLNLWKIILMIPVMKKTMIKKTSKLIKTFMVRIIRVKERRNLNFHSRQGPSETWRVRRQTFLYPTTQSLLMLSISTSITTITMDQVTKINNFCLMNRTKKKVSVPAILDQEFPLIIKMKMMMIVRTHRKR